MLNTTYFQGHKNTGIATFFPRSYTNRNVVNATSSINSESQCHTVATVETGRDRCALIQNTCSASKEINRRNIAMQQLIANLFQLLRLANVIRLESCLNWEGLMLETRVAIKSKSNV
jgi:hypothetical protein